MALSTPLSQPLKIPNESDLVGSKSRLAIEVMQERFLTNTKNNTHTSHKNTSNLLLTEAPTPNFSISAIIKDYK